MFSHATWRFVFPTCFQQMSSCKSHKFPRLTPPSSTYISNNAAYTRQQVGLCDGHHHHVASGIHPCPMPVYGCRGRTIRLLSAQGKLLYVCVVVWLCLWFHALQLAAPVTPQRAAFPWSSDVSHALALWYRCLVKQVKIGLNSSLNKGQML